MADLAQYWGNDLSAGPTGDLAIATGPYEVQQGILRALMTNPGDYIWDLGYGAGLPAMVGQPANRQRIAAIIRAQVMQSPGVATTPAPTVQVSVATNGVVTANITYSDAATGSTQTLSVPVS